MSSNFSGKIFCDANWFSPVKWNRLRASWIFQFFEAHAHWIQISIMHSELGTLYLGKARSYAWPFEIVPGSCHIWTRIQIEMNKLSTVLCVIFWHFYFILSIYFRMVSSSFTCLCVCTCALQVFRCFLLHGIHSHFASYIFGRLTLQIARRPSRLFLCFNYFTPLCMDLFRNVQIVSARALCFCCWAFRFF